MIRNTIKLLFKSREEKGYITLISVIIIGAVIFSIVLFMLTSGIDATKSSLIYTNSFRAKFLADACAEEALQQVRDNTSFTGSNTITLSGGTCFYSVTNTGASTRTIDATSTILSDTKKVRIFISAISPKIIISSWSDVAD
ncbi:MAG: hypothetical protein ACOYL8_00705 [Patescibacteria group bacterium]